VSEVKVGKKYKDKFLKMLDSKVKEQKLTIEQQAKEIQDLNNEVTFLKQSRFERDKEIERLKEVMTNLKNDLVNRADLRGDQYVDCSSSFWMALCEATE